MTAIRWWTITCALSLWTPLYAAAQISAEGSASGSADIESGANEASEIETSAGSAGSAGTEQHAEANVSGGGGGGGGPTGLRLAIQARIDAINTLATADPTGGGPGGGDLFFARRLFVPIVTPGVRLLDDSQLFLGLGLGFSGFSNDDPGPNEQSRSGWSLSPQVGYDLIRDSDVGAFSLLAGINLASLGETEDCDAGGCTDLNNDAFGWGLALGAGLRGFISPGLAIGGEFGWAFLDISADAGDDIFLHGIFGNILFEASIGICTQRHDAARYSGRIDSRVWR